MKLLLRLYPGWWRRRYGAEALDVLERAGRQTRRPLRRARRELGKQPDIAAVPRRHQHRFMNRNGSPSASVFANPREAPLVALLFTVRRVSAIRT
jgi:hypothetical protein